MEQVAITYGPISTQGPNQKVPNSEINQEEILDFAMLLQGLTLNSEQLPINFIEDNQNVELSVLLTQISNILELSEQPNLELMEWFKGLTNEQQIEVFQLVSKVTTSDKNLSQNPLILSAFDSTENSYLLSNSKISDKLEMFYQSSKELLTEKGLMKLDILSNDYSNLNQSANIFSKQEKVVFQNLNQINRQLQSNLDRPHTEQIVQVESDAKVINLNQSANIFSGQEKVVFQNLNQMNRQLQSNLDRLPTEQLVQVESDAKVINLNQMQFQYSNIQLNQIKTTVTDQKPMETIVANQNFASELGNVIINNLKLPNGISQTNIQLHPQELGQIEVKLVIQNGQITAQIVAETLLGKELLEGQIQQLKQSLTFQGYQVERIDVQQASNSTIVQNLRNGFSFSEQQSSQQNHREQTSSNQARLSEESDEFINTLYDTSGIDYTA